MTGNNLEIDTENDCENNGFKMDYISGYGFMPGCDRDSGDESS